MGLLEAWNKIPASMTRGITKAASHALKTPFGHSISTYARQASDFTHKVTEAYEDVNAAFKSAMGESLGEAAVSMVPGGAALLGAGRGVKRAFSAGKAVAASLKRARAEAGSTMARTNNDPFPAKRRRRR